MRKNFLATIPLILLLTAGVVFAQEHDFVQTKQLIDSGVSCAELSEGQLEAIGDYFMEQMHPGESHEFMDQMMGGEGSESLRQVHINMAKRLYCNENVYVGYGVMGPQMMGSGMMGPWMMNWQQNQSTAMMQNNPFGYQMPFWNYGYFGITNILYIALLIGLIALVFLGAFKFWKDINKKEAKK